MWWGTTVVILSQSSCKPKLLRCATVWRLRSCILHFKLHCCNVCSMWYWVVLLKCAWAFWRLRMLDENLLYFSALMVPSQKWTLLLAKPLVKNPKTQPHTMTDSGFWTCDSQDGVLPLWYEEHNIHFFKKRPDILITVVLDAVPSKGSENTVIHLRLSPLFFKHKTFCEIP